MKTTLTQLLCGSAALCLLPIQAQEQTAPAIPVDETALEQGTKEETAPATAAPAPAVEQSEGTAAITDYKDKIAGGLKERERRLTLLNEAMMKLREAGEMEDAARVEERIRALLEMPPPSQAHTQLKSEIDVLRAKNDELVIQMMAMEEELKRYRGPSKSSSSSRRTSSTSSSSGGSATALELTALEPEVRRAARP